MGLGVPGSDISTTAANCGHDAQFLSDLFQCGVLWKPLKGVNYGLFVRHKARLPFCSSACKPALKAR
jgi:hypothetical protein